MYFSNIAVVVHQTSSSWLTFQFGCRCCFCNLCIEWTSILVFYIISLFCAFTAIEYYYQQFLSLLFWCMSLSFSPMVCVSTSNSFSSLRPIFHSAALRSSLPYSPTRVIISFKHETAALAYRNALFPFLCVMLFFSLYLHINSSSINYDVDGNRGNHFSIFVHFVDVLAVVIVICPNIIVSKCTTNHLHHRVAEHIMKIISAMRIITNSYNTDTQ